MIHSAIISSITCTAIHMKITSDTMGILHKNVIDFNSTFSSVAIPKILIKYLLHTSHDSLGQVGPTKLYHFIKRLYYFPGMQKIIHKCVGTCQIYQIMNLSKPNYINLH